MTIVSAYRIYLDMNMVILMRLKPEWKNKIFLKNFAFRFYISFMMTAYHGNQTLQITPSTIYCIHKKTKIIEWHETRELLNPFKTSE